MKNIVYLLAVAFVAISCTPSLPEKYNSPGVAPQIYPDYTNVTVPVNIAPLAFEIKDSALSRTCETLPGEEAD